MLGQRYASVWAILFACFLFLTPARAEDPTVLWASDPVGPDQTVLLLGHAFGQDPRAEVRIEGADDGNREWQPVETLAATDTSLAFVVPPDWRPGVYGCRVIGGEGSSAPVTLNAPDPWWLQADRGDAASQGGWLRVFGKCLSFGKEARVTLRRRNGGETTHSPREASCYALTFDLPEDLPEGECEVLLHNGRGGPTAWREAGVLKVLVPSDWPDQVFDVATLGLEKALAAAADAGGGVIYLPRGRHRVNGAIELPVLTTLRGDGMERTSLFWPDMEDPPAALITGTSFRVEDLSLYCQQHRHVIAAPRDSEGVRIRRVRIRANNLFMQMEPGGEFRGRQAVSKHLEAGAALHLTGRNFEVTDCDIYASNFALALDPHGFTRRGPSYGLIAGNTLQYGGRGYRFEHTNCLIFEDNDLRGNHLCAIGNDISTFWNRSSENLYFANNRLRHMYGADREMMTLDAGGGAYFGTLASVQGTEMILAQDPVYGDYTPESMRGTDWTDAAALILEGRGAPQIRRVTGNDGCRWTVDRPWTVRPDASSLISIVPFRGHYLFVGNSFEDGGTLQLYGMSVNCIVAENRCQRMDGLLAWGRNPHGWGWQPSWFCQFLDNQILTGNAYGPRSTSIATFTSDNNEAYAGPLARGGIHRRNVIHSNGRIRIAGTTSGALVEHCVVRDSARGIEVGKGPQDVILRGNQFHDVQQEIAGEGLPEALILK